MDATFQAPLATPFYNDHVLYQVTPTAGMPPIRAWAFGGWKAESMSWKTGCYIHAGLSSTGPLSMKGPDAEKFLESLCINSFKKFPIGTMKHAVMCTERAEPRGIVERSPRITSSCSIVPLAIVKLRHLLRGRSEDADDTCSRSPGRIH
jgi:hypothetical protein